MLVKPKLVIITGPTGAGKSALAVEVALELGAEILNADSLAFYRGFDIGSAKPTPAERQSVPHHLFDVADPDDNFSAGDFVRLARPLIDSLTNQGKLPLVVGGTGLYLRSLTRGIFESPGRDDAFRGHLKELAQNGQNLYQLLTSLDPQSAAKIRPFDRARIERALEVFHQTGEGISSHQERHALAERPYNCLTVIVDRPVQELDHILKTRTRAIFDGGLIEETRALLAKGLSSELKPFKTVGYLEATEFLAGRMSLEQARESTFRRTRQLAKRQRTWFRGQCPDGLWMFPAPASVIEVIRDFWVH
ncbi:MAG: tRNA (adenosine(37)-N6)-dimethylallyltransferase MiaA [Deltaproteobacteria bacterium]|nr:tRNA (adenosine(37)-N6)-dimethylallyltransferase MiaA [Deltaproteobacteria bacterium]